MIYKEAAALWDNEAVKGRRTFAGMAETMPDEALPLLVAGAKNKSIQEACRRELERRRIENERWWT